MKKPLISEQTSMLKLSNNQTIRYLKTGSGAPLILMHTIRTQLEYFYQAIPTLAKHYTVYAIDLPGHGESSIDTKAQYDEPYLRKAVVEFIHTLNLNNVTVAGESIGATLALTVASALPERITRVIASNTYDYETRYADGVRRGNWFANIVIANYAIPIHGAIFAASENWLFLGFCMQGGLKRKSWMPSQLLSAINSAGYRKGYRYVERNVFSHWRSWANARSLYTGVKAPVTLIYGDHDWSTLAERQRTAKDLGYIDFVTLTNTGHFSFVDNPDELLNFILSAHQ
jgi:pimeloyl-ACP methyl ester carboxylesterase